MKKKFFSLLHQNYFLPDPIEIEEKMLAEQKRKCTVRSREFYWLSKSPLLIRFTIFFIETFFILQDVTKHLLEVKAALE